MSVGLAVAARLGGAGILQVMPVAWVGDNGQGGFSAWVDYDDPGPFSYTQGPSDVLLADALSWARQQASKVILRVGDMHYSAGEEQAGSKPAWTQDVGPPSSRTDSAGSPVGWRVDAGMGWFRQDREAIAKRLALAVERDPRTADIAIALRRPGFSVCFTLRARSKVEADKVASEILQGAWAALDARAEPGEDFDVSHISVQPASTPDLPPAHGGGVG